MKDFEFLSEIRDNLVKNDSRYNFIHFSPNPVDVLDHERPFETKKWRMELYFGLGKIEKDGVKYFLMGCGWFPKEGDPLYMKAHFHLTLAYQEGNNWNFQNF